MNKRVFNFELEGKPVLGFDTGLDARAFAQTKMAQFITQPGYIVFPDGKVETWRSEGVTEKTSIIIWGPYFPGEELVEIILRPDEALDAFRFWLRARIFLEENTGHGEESSFPGPAGAFMITVRQAAKRASAEESYPFGTVFFPPSRLLKRTLDAGGILLDTQRWTHPDLSGAEEISFSAGAMLYQLFCGNSPFNRKEKNELREDIREGVFVPPNLAAPGLDPEMAELITQAIGPIPKSRETQPRPTPDFIIDFIGPPASKPASFWVKTLSEKEILSTRTAHKQYEKRTGNAVKTRRFLIRNTAAIATISILLFVSTLFIRSVIQSRAQLPTTAGMSAIEVVEAYYNAFSVLDHVMMQACVTGRAGRDDIQTATGIFVISRVRQAYETGEIIMPAHEWLEADRPDTDKIVFGITDLTISVLSENGVTATFEATYILWIPLAGEDDPVALPTGIYTRDIVSLVFQRNAWRITNIERTIISN